MVAAVIGGIIGAVIGAIGGLMFGGPSATKAITRHLERKQAEEFLADNYLPLIAAVDYLLDCEQKMVAAQADADRPDRQKRRKTTYPKLDMIRRLQQLLSELRMDDLIDRYDAALRKSPDLSSPNGN